jgi:hypothetical protein
MSNLATFQIELEEQYKRDEEYAIVDATFTMSDEISALHPILKSKLGITNPGLWEKPIYEAYKALLIGMHSNYQTSISIFANFLDQTMPLAKTTEPDGTVKTIKASKLLQLQRAEKLLSVISENSFALEVLDGRYNRVVIHTTESVELLATDKPVSFPMVIKPTKVTKNDDAGYKRIKRPVLIGRALMHKKQLSLDVINIQNSIPLTINPRSIDRLLAVSAEASLNPQNKQGFDKPWDLFYIEIQNEELLRKRMKDFIARVGDNPIYCTHGYDSRGRLYSLDNVFDYQRDKSILQLHNKKKLNQMGIWYLVMDLATHYGSCSSKLSAEIHTWYKSNVNKTFFGISLSKLRIDPQSPFKGDKSTWGMRTLQGLHHLTHAPSKDDIDDYREYHNTRDALVDHFQHKKPTGVLIGLDATCSAAQIISLSAGDFTGMINSNVLAHSNEDKRYDIYQAISDATNNVLDRERMKYIVMPEFYNSKAKVKEVFPDEKEREVYCKARDSVIPSGQAVLNDINNLWDTKAKYFSWYLPDGHFSTIRAYENADAELECDDIDATLFFKYREYGASEYYIPLAANIIQSIDAYINRLMIRKAHAKGISIITVHDCFLTHPNDVHTLKSLFTECLIQVHEEQVLASIFKQLGGYFSANMPHKVVSKWFKEYPNKYAIC